jgi:hypothetical protein
MKKKLQDGKFFLKSTLLCALCILLITQKSYSYASAKTDLTTYDNNISKIVSVRGTHYFMFGSSLQKDTTYFDSQLKHVADFDCFEVTDTCVIVGNL